MTPIIPPDGVTVNLARGLMGAAEKLVKRAHPLGEKVWNGGLGEVVKRAIQQNPAIPDKDFTAVELAERMGILKPERKVRKRR